jgi:hypothetical protein
VTITATAEGVSANTAITVVAQVNLVYGVASNATSATAYAATEALNNPGDTVTSRRTGAGTYELQLPGMAASLSARRFIYVNSRDAAAQCHPAGTPTASTHVMVATIVCAAVTTGAAVDAVFSYMALGPDALSGRVGFMVTPVGFVDATPTAATSPHSVTSRGLDATATVDRSSIGRYTFAFTALGRGGSDIAENHFAQSWDATTALWCASGGWTASGFVADVYCYNAAGAATDTRIGTLIIDRGRAGRRGAVSWVNVPGGGTPSSNWTSSTGGAVSVASPATGTSDVTFAGLAGSASVPLGIIVSSYGSGVNSHCAITNTSRTGADFVVRVQCVAPGTGTARAQQFSLAVIE